jgi:hypothetical protein
MRANLNFFKPEIPDAAQLRVAVAPLPTPFRKTLVLRDIESLDCREISDAIEVPDLFSQAYIQILSELNKFTGLL